MASRLLLELGLSQALEVNVPYGMCVISGLVAGVISMAALLHTDTPRATPLAEFPLGTSVASARTLTLERYADATHNASAMFDNVAPAVRSAPDVPSSPLGVTLPIGEVVTVTCSSGFDRIRGRLESADIDWLQIAGDGGRRVWVSKAQVISISTDDGAALAQH